MEAKGTERRLTASGACCIGQQRNDSEVERSEVKTGTINEVMDCGVCAYSREYRSETEV